jgi:glutaredoxin
MGVPYVAVEVDKLAAAKGKPTRAALKSLTSQSTLPQLFVGGKSTGGCDDFKARCHARDFAFIAPYITQPPATGGRVNSAYSLFWFPHTIDNNNARISAALQCIVIVLCLAFWLQPATKWVVLALTVDFFLRFLFGGSLSVLAMIASALLANARPVVKSGPPKQFAAFCGFAFSVWATGLYAGGYPVGGSIILGALLGCCLLEAAFNFCV